MIIPCLKMVYIKKVDSTINCKSLVKKFGLKPVGTTDRILMAFKSNAIFGLNQLRVLKCRWRCIEIGIQEISDHWVSANLFAESYQYGS